MTGQTDSLAGRASTAFAQYRDGQPEGMSALVDATTTLLWHTARSQGLDPAQAEDVVQNTFLQLVQRTDTISDPGGILKWLLTTTKREAWATARRSRREDVRDDLREDGSGSIGGPDVQAGPEQLVLRSHEQGVLWKHFASLPGRCQELLRVIALAERPDYAQVAEALGMPIGSIGPTRGRCLARLRLALVADPAWEVAS